MVPTTNGGPFNPEEGEALVEILTAGLLERQPPYRSFDFREPRSGARVEVKTAFVSANGALRLSAVRSGYLDILVALGLPGAEPVYVLPEPVVAEHLSSSRRGQRDRLEIGSHRATALANWRCSRDNLRSRIEQLTEGRHFVRVVLGEGIQGAANWTRVRQKVEKEIWRSGWRIVLRGRTVTEEGELEDQCESEGMVCKYIDPAERHLELTVPAEPPSTKAEIECWVDAVLMFIEEVEAPDDFDWEQ